LPSNILVRVVKILKENGYTCIYYLKHGKVIILFNKKVINNNNDKTINNNEVYNSCNKPGIISRLFGKRKIYASLKTD